MNNSQERNNVDISLKEFILKIKEYFIEILKKWYIVTFSCLIFGAFLGINTYRKKPNYVAQLTFMVNEESGPSFNSVAANILGKFGGGSGKYNLEKILALSKSRSIIEEALLTTTIVDQKTDILANHFIRIYKLNEGKHQINIENFYFSKDSIADIKGSFVSSIIYELLIGDDGLFSSSTNDKSGIMTLKCATINEDLSEKFIMSVYDKLSSYYVNKSVEKERITYNLLKKRVEALYGKMNNELDKSTTYSDKILGIWEDQSRLPVVKYSRDSRITTEVYGEVLKNLEIADFTLKSKTPFIQQIDYPRKPLRVEEKSYILSGIIGVILGFILAVFIIIIRKIIKNAFNPQSS